MRLCILTNILPPYRVGFFNELARLCDLHVVFDSLTTPDRQWEIDSRSIGFACTVAGSHHAAIDRPGVGYAAERRYFQFSERTLPLLRRIAPDIVVSLELGARTAQAAGYAFVRQIPLVCYWEGTPHTESRVPWFKPPLRRALAARAAAFWVNGRDSADYARTLGVPAERVHPGMTGVDTSYFVAESRLARQARDATRGELGLSGTTFVFSGQFAPRKGIDAYLRAMHRLFEIAPGLDASFLFIGDGPQRRDIEEFARTHPRVPVVVTGFVQLPMLPRLYTAGDCFVLPTLEDCWPLATLEPLVCGLPQIFSRYNGAAADLAGWPDAGTVVDPLDTRQFADALRSTVERRPAPLTDRIVGDVAEFYSPRSQAQRAYASCQRVLNGAKFEPAAIRSHS